MYAIYNKWNIQFKYSYFEYFETIRGNYSYSSVLQCRFSTQYLPMDSCTCVISPPIALASIDDEPPAPPPPGYPDRRWGLTPPCSDPPDDFSEPTMLPPPLRIGPYAEPCADPPPGPSPVPRPRARKLLLRQGELPFTRRASWSMRRALLTNSSPPRERRREREGEGEREE